MQWIRSHLSFANSISLIALFVALGGTSFAAVALTKNSVGAAQIKKNAVAASEIKKNAVRAAEVRSNAVGASELRSNAVASGDIADNGVGGADLSDNSVGAGEISDGSVGSGEVTDGSLVKGDFAPGVIPVRAFARVQANGLLTPTSAADGPVQADGITQEMIQHVNTAPASSNTGQYCFDLDFVPRNAMVAIDNRDQAATSNQIISVSTTRGTPLTQCPAPFQDMRVNILIVGDGVTTDLIDQDFYVWVMG